MLPLYGLAVVAAKQGDPAGFVAITIVVAQAVMIVASLVAMRMAEKEGYWLVLLISFMALPIRGVRRGACRSTSGASIPCRFSTASAPDCRASRCPAWSRAS